ncbi:MAG: RecX family transcriptional regulator [bacterium]
MTEANPSLKVLEVIRVPRKPERMVRLSDGSVLLAFEEDLAQMGIFENALIPASTVDEIKHCYQRRKAKEIAIRLLKTRLRTEAELRRRFSKFKIEQDVQTSLIEELKMNRLVDDLRFARLWIVERKSRFGMERIIRELMAKGVDSAIIEEAMSLEYDVRDEASRIEEILKKRLERLKGLEPNVIKRKLYQYLIRRGFESDLVSEIIGKAIG